MPLDTSSIIGFLVEIEGADLLRQLIDLGNQLVVCPSVRAELRRPETRRRADAFEGFAYTGPESPEVRTRLKARYPGLGSGEVEVLAFGLRARAAGIEFLLVLDDLGARKAAEALGLPRTGAVGLIRLIEQAGRLDAQQAEARVNELKAGGFRFEEP